MTTLVTGATGLLGNNVVRLLASQGKPVRVLIRNPGDAQKTLAEVNAEIVRGDVREQAAVEEAMRNVSVVVHCAGYVHIGWSNLEAHREVNVEGTRKIAEAARRAGARLMHVSSVNALGLGGRDFEADETTARPGITPCPYVVTKQEAEAMLLEMTAAGLDAVIINPSFMLGPWDWKPSSGRMMVEISQHYAPLAPSGSFNVCDVRDVASGIQAAIEKGTSGRRYILGGHNISYFRLWRAIAKTCGVWGPFSPAGPMQRYTIGLFGDMAYKLTGKEPDLNSAGVRMSSQHHRFKCDRAMSELGYTFRPLQETLDDTWRWFNEHGYVKARKRMA